MLQPLNMKGYAPGVGVTLFYKMEYVCVGGGLVWSGLGLGIACIGGPGVLKFGFGRDVPPRNLKIDPYKYKFFKKQWSIHIPICSILGQILSKIAWFFQNCLKFEPIKSTHSYTKFCILYGIIHIPRGWFCYPCWRHIPVGSFVLSTPSPELSGAYFESCQNPERVFVTLQPWSQWLSCWCC